MVGSKRYAVLGCAVIGLLGGLVPAAPASARDEIVKLKWRRSVEPGGLRFHYWGEGTRPVLATATEVTVARRTRNRNDTQHDCYWALQSAIDALAERARAVGADTIVEVRSNWKHRPGTVPGTFDCAIGMLQVGVALRAYVGKLAPPPAPAPAAAVAAVPAPAPAGTVVAGRDPAGNATYQIVLGDSRVGLKLLASPDLQPAQVKLALALRAAGQSDRPHASCGVELESNGVKEALPAVRYQRSAGQETLYTEISSEQLRKLAGGGGALLICATRIAIGESSQRGITVLLHAVDAHLARSAPIKPGEELSL